MDSVTDFVADTVGLVRYLEDSLPPAANRAFKEAERGRAMIFLPEIALGEFLYITLRGRVRISDPVSLAGEVLDQLRSAAYITLSPLSLEAWKTFLGLNISELHDRMIAADAMSRGLPLISNNPSFAAVKQLRTIWR